MSGCIYEFRQTSMRNTNEFCFVFSRNNFSVFSEYAELPTVDVTCHEYQRIVLGVGDVFQFYFWKLKWPCEDVALVVLPYLKRCLTAECCY